MTQLQKNIELMKLIADFVEQVEKCNYRTVEAVGTNTAISHKLTMNQHYINLAAVLRGYNKPVVWSDNG